MSNPFICSISTALCCIICSVQGAPRIVGDEPGIPRACGSAAEPMVPPVEPPPQSFALPTFKEPATGQVSVVLGIVCDRECQALAGSREKFEADLRTIMDVVQGYYRQLEVRLQLNPVYYVEGTRNPWENAKDSYRTNADNFRRWAAAKYPYPHNAALLFTGQDFDGIDYAWVGHVCAGDAYRYGQIDYAYRQPITQKANLTAHELGHILGADHAVTSRILIMSPSIYDGALSWDDAALDSIHAVLSKDSRCLQLSVSLMPSAPRLTTYAEWEANGNGRYQAFGSDLYRRGKISVRDLRGRVLETIRR